MRKQYMWIVCAICVAMLGSSCLFEQGNAAPTEPTLPHVETVEIGAFISGDPLQVSNVQAYETATGRHVFSILRYQGWDATNQPDFPSQEFRDAVLYHDGFNTQTILHLTWEPWVNLPDIANGTYDEYLTRYADQVHDWGGAVRLRFAHEMIQDGVSCYGQAGCGDWYPWQDQPAQYVAAFRHVHDIFQTRGASNVEFVWCPNNYPFDLDLVRQYYPGADYVDWLCMDGYNWTNRDSKPGWPDWQWFDDIFYNIYQTFVDHPEVFGSKPVMIGEFASCEAGAGDLPGQTKAAWIENAFERIKSTDYNQIDSFYWFNINKECDWRADSSPESLAAFRTAIAGASFISHPGSFNAYVPMLAAKRATDMVCLGR